MAKNRQYEYRSSEKSRLVALILCVGGGFLGLHYFYVNRYWRAALNLVLAMTVFIMTNIFGLRYIRVSLGNESGIFMYWRDGVAVCAAAILGLTWIWDIVRLAQCKFRDSEKLPLRQ